MQLSHFVVKETSQNGGVEKEPIERRAGDALEYDWATFDALFWCSAIFSREAMSVNHVSPHKYGDRKALGVFRVVSACFSFTLFSFLTAYESQILKNRCYLTMPWWISLGTCIYFVLSIVHYKHYFDEKGPIVQTASDGSHPFYLWKFNTSLNGLLLQAGLHFAILSCFKNQQVNMV